MIGSKYFNYLPTSKAFYVNFLTGFVCIALIGWWLPRTGFVKRSGLPPRVLQVLLLIKIVTGFIVGVLSLHYTESDYWLLNSEAWKEYQLLLQHPGEYFSNLFVSPYNKGYGDVLGTDNSYWNDLKGNIIIKLLSVFNIISRGDYYVNSIFFNSLVFTGHVALYRVFSQVYPGRQQAVIVGCFLLPSLLYFSSAIHKDGLVFTATAILMYVLYTAMEQQRFTIRRILLITGMAAAIFMLRNLAFLALVPALTAVLLAYAAGRRIGLIFAGVFVLGIFLFFTVRHFSPALDFPAVMAKRQAFYLAHNTATTAIAMDTLGTEAGSYLRNLPQVINHSFMRPYLTEHSSLFLSPLAAELLVYQLLFLCFLFFRRRQLLSRACRLVILFGLCFAVAVYCSMGFIVNNLGTIVRYRSIYFPLLITPLLATIEWKKIALLFRLKK